MGASFARIFGQNKKFDNNVELASYLGISKQT